MLVGVHAQICFRVCVCTRRVLSNSGTAVILACTYISCVCVCMCVYVCVYVCACVSACVSVSVCVWCVCVHVCMCVCACLCVCGFLYFCVCARMYMRVFVCDYECAHEYEHVCTLHVAWQIYSVHTVQVYMCRTVPQNIHIYYIVYSMRPMIATSMLKQTSYTFGKGVLH